MEQIGIGHADGGGSALQQRSGAIVRAAGLQSAMHLAWWEADAWARWAGRRIVTEVEWEIAAHTAVRRGLRWGQVQKGTADPWSAGTSFDPDSAWGRARMHALRWRSFAPPGRDNGFFGFRTCTL